MAKKHLKVLAAPKTWPLKRKSSGKFITKPNPGQKLEFSLPMNFVIRNLLSYASSSSETKNLLSHNHVMVNGVRRKELKFSIGLFDTLSVQETKSFFRIVINSKGKLDVSKISEDESKIKPCRIIGKTFLSGKKIQVNLYDGRNILIGNNDYKVGDTLIISIPENSVKKHLKFEKNAKVFLVGGRHIGETGIIEDIRQNRIIYKNDKEEGLETLKKYAFVIE